MAPKYIQSNLDLHTVLVDYLLSTNKEFKNLFKHEIQLYLQE